MVTKTTAAVRALTSYTTTTTTTNDNNTDNTDNTNNANDINHDINNANNHINNNTVTVRRQGTPAAARAWAFSPRSTGCSLQGGAVGGGCSGWGVVLYSKTAYNIM